MRPRDLAEWAAEHPPRLKRRVMEVPRMMRCRYCGKQTLNGLLSGSIDHMSNHSREPADQQNDE